MYEVELEIIMAFFALLFLLGLLFFNRKATTRQKKKRDNYARLLAKVETDLKSGNIDKAISRLTGALENYPPDRELLYKLSALLIQNKEYKKAGRILYLKEHKSQEEQEAVTHFENSLGNDPTLILKKLIRKRFFRFKDLNESELNKLAALLSASKEKEKTTAAFLRSLDQYIQKANSGRRY